MTSEKEPKQDKEAQRARWAWVEHRLWTDSMLRSLKKGSKEENGKEHQWWRIPFFDEAGLFKPDSSTARGPIEPETILKLEYLSLTVRPHQLESRMRK